MTSDVKPFNAESISNYAIIDFKSNEVANPNIRILMAQHMTDDIPHVDPAEILYMTKLDIVGIRLENIPEFKFCIRKILTDSYSSNIITSLNHVLIWNLKMTIYQFKDQIIKKMIENYIFSGGFTNEKEVFQVPPAVDIIDIFGPRE